MQKKKNKNLSPPGTAFLSSYYRIITLRISKLVRVPQSLSLECLTLHFTYLKDLCAWRVQRKEGQLWGPCPYPRPPVPTPWPEQYKAASKTSLEHLLAQQPRTAGNMEHLQCSSLSDLLKGIFRKRMIRTRSDMQEYCI